MITTNFSSIPKNCFQMVRNDLLNVDTNLVEEIEAVEAMGRLRLAYFGNVYSKLLEIKKEAPERPLTLEEKRKFLAPVPFHEEKYVPCRVMWVKVIIRAAYDNALWKTSPDLRLRKYAFDARKWLFEPSTLFNSFENICFLFQLPQKALLEWAKNLTRDQVKKFEFLERNGKDPMTLSLESQIRAADGVTK